MLIWGIVGILVLAGALIAMVSLSGAKGSPTTKGTDTPSGPTQVVRVAVEGYEYVPDMVTVESGKPVTFIVDATRAAGCARFFVFREYGISKLLDPGENTFTFTPTRTGTFEFSCSMRMVIGNMVVQ